MGPWSHGMKSLDYHNSNAKYLLELQTTTSFYCHNSVEAGEEKSQQNLFGLI